MSDDVARAVGSGSPEGLTINGKALQLRPLNIRELGELERDCLKHYKRNYLKSFTDNADILPNYEELILKKAEECARWDIGDLPKKYVFDVSNIEITPKLKARMMSIAGTVIGDFTDKAMKQVLMNILDKSAMSPEEVKKLAGKTPKSMATGYVNWWITADPDGMVSLVYHCLKNQGVSREEIEAKFSDKEADLTTIARDIEHLSSPQVKNG